MPSEAELKRRDSANQLQDWALVPDDANAETGISDPSIEFGVRSRLDEVKAKLDSLLTELTQKYEGGAIALDAATLAALESVTATVLNLPASYPLPTSQLDTLTPQTDALTNTQLRATPVKTDDDATQTKLDEVASKLDSILTELGQKLEAGGTVALSESSLNALESISVTVLNPTANPETGLAKETTLQALKGEVDGLEEAVGTTADPSGNSTVIGRLKRLVELLSGTLTVDDGHPDPQLDALTNAQLRASDVAVTLDGETVVVNDGHLDPQQDALTDAQLRATAVPVADAQVADALANRYGGGKTAYAALVSSAGDNIAISPAPGNAIRVWWVSFVPDPDNASNPLVTVKFDSGITMYVGYAMAHWEKFEGDADQSVIVNLSEARSVAVTIHYEEFVP